MQGYNEPESFTNFISDILLGIGGSASYSAIYGSVTCWTSCLNM